jgi:hypothetical protein
VISLQLLHLASQTLEPLFAAGELYPFVGEGLAELFDRGLALRLLGRRLLNGGVAAFDLLAEAGCAF